ncbi:hypothetical protein EWM64_g5097 [Hericium alpestre]|uniref:Uncharacterized protein n=1 Tax=Hericium alpestre TaxID=135208 RepID=A0A4Y9ZVL1_9AGAM|nr:hypothetical protein EWM64_g5097 [Hericium alpestre]
MELPEKCKGHQFCPDEGSSCQEKLPVDSPCQLNRDDECLGPPDFQDLRDTTGYGLNVNGSVCLNFVCQWANVTVGNKCVTENTGYIAYAPGGNEFGFIVSRIGLYCDTQQQTCMQQQTVGASCNADKDPPRCTTLNCLPGGTCGAVTGDTRHLGKWVYVVVAIAIFGGMTATLILFFFLHGRQRDVEREKRMQYWREQNAAAPAKSSGLRHYVSDDGMYDGENEDLVSRSPYLDDKKF